MTTMATTWLSRRYYDDDEDSSTYWITIGIVLAVIFVVKIGIITGLCWYRSKKRRERAARGCTCFVGNDYFITRWWIWGSNKRCHCGAYNSTDTAYPKTYTGGTTYPHTEYASAPQTELGTWSSMEEEESLPLKPTEQVHTDGRYY